MSSKNVKAAAVANYCGAMESETISKNGASSKSHMSRGNNLMPVAIISLIFIALNYFVMSCGPTKETTTPKPIPPNIYSAIYVSEERGVNFERITTDADAVASPGYNATNKTSATTAPTKYGVRWYPYAVIALSAGDERIGFIADRNNATNVMLKSATQGGGSSTQQTFRSDVRGFTFSPDGQRFLFSEFRNGNIGIYMMNVGSTIVQQISPSVSYDNVPTVSKNNILFFDRREGGNFNYALWSYDMDTRIFSSYSQGYSPCVDPSNDKSVYFARFTNENIFDAYTSSTPAARSTPSTTKTDIRAVLGLSTSTSTSTTSTSSTSTSEPTRPIDSRRSEILRFDAENGTEELILSDQSMSFSSPQVSPDGKWILVTGAKKSTDEIWNTDIFVVRSNGTNFTQLTYHPGNDMSAIWSADGKSIYFVSQRGTEDGKYNVWRMNFQLSAD